MLLENQRLEAEFTETDLSERALLRRDFIHSLLCGTDCRSIVASALSSVPQAKREEAARDVARALFYIADTVADVTLAFEAREASDAQEP